MKGCRFFFYFFVEKSKENSEWGKVTRPQRQVLYTDKRQKTSKHCQFLGFALYTPIFLHFHKLISYFSSIYL